MRFQPIRRVALAQIQHAATGWKISTSFVRALIMKMFAMSAVSATLLHTSRVCVIKSNNDNTWQAKQATSETSTNKRIRYCTHTPPAAALLLLLPLLLLASLTQFLHNYEGN